jgi:hypothetical protein
LLLGSTKSPGPIPLIFRFNLLIHLWLYSRGCFSLSSITPAVIFPVFLCFTFLRFSQCVPGTLFDNFTRKVVSTFPNESEPMLSRI